MGEKHREFLYYLLLTVVALTLMGSGAYMMNHGGVLYIVFGVLLVLIGYIIGWFIYGENWGDWH